MTTTKGPSLVEQAQAYLDGWNGKSDLRVGPLMLAGMVEDLASYITELEGVKARSGALEHALQLVLPVAEAHAASRPAYRDRIEFAEAVLADPEATSSDPDDELRARAEAAEANSARLEEALRPSADTKAAYAFSFPVTLRLGRETETRFVAVPWETVVQIMTAIRSRAALEQTKGESA